MPFISAKLYINLIININLKIFKKTNIEILAYFLNTAVNLCMIDNMELKYLFVNCINLYLMQNFDKNLKLLRHMKESNRYRYFI